MKYVGRVCKKNWLQKKLPSSYQEQHKPQSTQPKLDYAHAKNKTHHMCISPCKIHTRDIIPMVLGSIYSINSSTQLFMTSTIAHECVGLKQKSMLHWRVCRAPIVIDSGTAPVLIKNVKCDIRIWAGRRNLIRRWY
jgi:hypothetical protein